MTSLHQHQHNFRAAALALLARWARGSAGSSAVAVARGGGGGVATSSSTIITTRPLLPSCGGVQAAPVATFCTSTSWQATTAAPPRTRPHQHQQHRTSASSAASGNAVDHGDNRTKHIVDPELLSLLACPLTKQPLVVEDDAKVGDNDNENENDVTGFLLSRAAGARFPVGRGGVPRLRPLQDGEVVAGDEGEGGDDDARRID